MSTTSVSDVAIVAAYLQHISLAKHRSHATVAAYSNDLCQLLSWLRKGGLTIKSAATEDVALYYDHLRTTYKPASAARKFAAIRSLYRWLDKTKTCNDVAKDVGYAPAPAKQIRVLSQSQIDSIIDHVRRDTTAGLRDRLAIAIVAATGIRVERVRHIKLREVDVHNGGLLVDGQPYLLSRSVLDMMIAYLNEREDGSSMLLVNHRGDTITSRSLRRKLEQYALSSGVAGQVGGRVTFSMLRHSLAKRLLEEGVTPRRVAARLGNLSHINPRLYVQQFAKAS